MASEEDIDGMVAEDDRTEEEKQKEILLFMKHESPAPAETVNQTNALGLQDISDTPTLPSITFTSSRTASPMAHDYGHSYELTPGLSTPGSSASTSRSSSILSSPSILSADLSADYSYSPQAYATDPHIMCKSCSCLTSVSFTHCPCPLHSPI